MEIVDRHGVIEETLEVWQAALGTASTAYRGHTYRVFNLSRRLLGREDSDDVLAITSAFHDLGIWSDQTFDYLAPSAARAVSFCQDHAVEVDVDLVVRAIDNHHALRRYTTAPTPELIEAFRRGDLVDVSRGWLRAGLDRRWLRELTAQWPYAGFHRIILGKAFGWMLRHPLRPLPMLR
jgi:hypothetical protein